MAYLDGSGLAYYHSKVAALIENTADDIQGEVDDLKSAFNRYSINWAEGESADCERGSVATGNGGDNNQVVNRLRSKGFITNEDTILISTKSGYKFAIFAYDKDVAGFSGYAGGWNGRVFDTTNPVLSWETDYQITNYNYKYRILLRREPDQNGAMDVEEWSNLLTAVRYTTDTTLSIANAPADAKAVGDAIRNLDVETDDTLSLEGKAADAKATGDEINGVKNSIDNIVPELVDKSRPFTIPASSAVAPNLLDENRNVLQKPKYRYISPITFESGDICIEFTAPGCSMIVYVWKQTGEDTYQLIANSGWTTRPVVVHGEEGVSFGMSFHDDTDTNITNAVVTSNLTIYYLYDLAEIKSGAALEVSVDDTLTETGVPADAKATGDAIGNAVESLESTMLELTTEKVQSSNNFEIGTLGPEDGVGRGVKNNARIRSKVYFEGENVFAFYADTGYQFLVLAYYKVLPDGVADPYVGVWTGSIFFKTNNPANYWRNEFVITNRTYKYKILLRHDGDTGFNVGMNPNEDEKHLLLSVSKSSGTNVTIDNTLSQAGEAADAKKTGDEIGLLDGRVGAVEEIADTLFDMHLVEDKWPDTYANAVISPLTGGDISPTPANADTRLRSTHRIDADNIVSVHAKQGYVIAVYAYYKVLPDGVTNEYVGIWNGTSFASRNSIPSSGWVDNFKITNKDYKYRIMLRAENDAVISATDSNWSNCYVLKVKEEQTVDSAVKSYIDPDIVEIIQNAVGREANTVLDRDTSIFNTINFYPIDEADVGKKFYINTVCYISEYSGKNISDYIKPTTLYDHDSIITFDERTRYVRISYVKKDVPDDKFLLIPISDNMANVLTDVFNNAYNQPPTFAMANIMARVNQMLNVEYTTVAPMPISGTSHGYWGHTVEGEKIKGLPYSSTRSVCKYIGQHVSMYTFLTAIKNPKSVLYTRRITYGGLGKTLGATYYGTTCFTLPSYAYGSKLGYFDNLRRERDDTTKFELISPYDVQIGDILITSRYAGTGGHVGIVCGLHKDKYGRIKAISVGESTPPSCRAIIRDFKVENNGATITRGNYDFYPYRLKNRIDRRTGLPTNMEYEQIPYTIGFDDEVPTEVPDLPIMSEFGDKAAIEAYSSDWDGNNDYKTAYGEQPPRNVTINVNLPAGNPDGYNSVTVYRRDNANGTFEEFTGKTDEVINEVSTVVSKLLKGLPADDFKIYDIPWGEYKFVLSNSGGSKTVESYLVAVDVYGYYATNNNNEVISQVTGFDKSNNTITFSSRNATPVFAVGYADTTVVGGKPGVQGDVIRFSQSEVNNGSANVSATIDNKHNQIQIGFLVEGYGVAMWRSCDLQTYDANRRPSQEGYTEWEYWDTTWTPSQAMQDEDVRDAE